VDRAKRLGLGVAALGAGVIAWVARGTPRERFLRAARRELGSRDWERYTEGVLDPPTTPATRPYWCGIFALWALHKAGFACDVKWDLRTGRGFLHRLRTTTDPKPGDMAYLHAYQHHAIVERVTPDGMVHTIDGNTMPDSRVARRVRPKNEFAFFYDTTPLFERKC
jgi:hypothetical protein